MTPRPRRSRCSRVALITRDSCRRNRPRVLVAITLVAAMIGGASLGFALNQDAASQPVGLQGVWPDFPPPSLSVAEFSKLDQRWAEWSRAAAIDVAKMYSLSGLTVEQQYERLAQVEQRIGVLKEALRDPAYSMIRNELTNVLVPLELRANLFRAMLDLLTADAAPAAAEALPVARTEFQNALRRVRSYLNSIPNGAAWFPYLEIEEIEQSLQTDHALEEIEALAARLDPTAEGLNDAQVEFLRRSHLENLAGATRYYATMLQISKNGADQNAVRQELAALVEAVDLYEDSPTNETAAAIRTADDRLRLVAGPLAEAIDDLLRKQYLNYNLRLVADADFISKIVSTNEITRGPVRDCFMGASIYGNQKTRTTANLAFIPSSDAARFKLMLDGVSNSRTNAYTNQATVSSVSQIEFFASKPIFFDGDRFGFGPASVSANPHLRHTGIATKYDHIFFGLFKGLIRRRAMSEANKRIPQGRAHAVDELRAKLLPEFNGEVERSFGELNQELARFDAELAEENLTPSAERTRTTSERFLFDAAVRGNSELSGSAPNIGSTRGIGFTLQIHESLLNNMADRWDLAGKSMTEAEVREVLEQWFSDLLGSDVSFDDESGEPPDPSILTFHESDPIRFEVSDGALRLILRAGITTEDGDEIPTQVVEVPLDITIENGKIHINRGVVIVSPLERPRNRALQITRAGIMRKKIQDAIEEGTQDATLTIERDGQEPIQIEIQRITAQGGWLTVFGI